jgi:signal peptidase I
MASLSGGQKSPVDARIAAYRFVKYTALLLVVAALVKLIAFETVVITTDQMSPTLVKGDRVVVQRIRPFGLFFWLWPPKHGTPVVATHPLLVKKIACLRVAGLPGDSMVIGKGIFSIVNGAAVTLGGSVPPAETLLPEFTPRDSMEGYRLPRPGDTLDLDLLSLRDFFFAAAMIKQERSGRRISVKADCDISGKRMNDVPMTNFSLYKGTLDKIPERYLYNWFFWDRLREYWIRTAAGRNCTLRFELFDDTVRITKYVIRRSFIFLLADDWQKGFDSRYFGPLMARSIKGRVVCVLWSITPGGWIFGSLRGDRIMKIVK